MLTALSNFFFRHGKWSLTPNIPDELYKKCVIIAAPHTTNWDFFITISVFNQLKIPVRFAIKKEANFPVIGKWIEKMGAIWIDRGKDESGKRKSYVDQMVELFEERDELVLVLAAEGTRSLVKNWKTGFYHVARKANVPIALGFLDYEKKLAGFGPIFQPSDDMEADMRRLMEFYSDKVGHTPEKFMLDERYV